MSTHSPYIQNAEVFPGMGEVEQIAIDYFFAVLSELYPSPPSPPPQYSESFLRGQAGVLHLARLEAAGICSASNTAGMNVRDGFKTVIEACTFLMPARRDEAVDQFVDQVIDFTSNYFSLEGRTILGADILVGESDEDTDLDMLAKILWETRAERMV